MYSNAIANKKYKGMGPQDWYLYMYVLSVCLLCSSLYSRGASGPCCTCAFTDHPSLLSPPPPSIWILCLLQGIDS